MSCFVTLGGTYKCKVMTVGMKTSSATFQRRMNIVTEDLEECVTYIDDLHIFSDTWEKHMDSIEKFIRRLEEVNLKPR